MVPQLGMTSQAGREKMESEGSHDLFGSFTDGLYVNSYTYRGGELRVTTSAVEPVRVGRYFFAESHEKVVGFQVTVSVGERLAAAVVLTNDREVAKRLHEIAVTALQRSHEPHTALDEVEGRASLFSVHYELQPM